MKIEEQSAQILDAFRKRFVEVIVPKHIQRTKALADPKQFDINPFLAPYLSAFLTGKVSRNGISTALVLTRALGSSINTSFGTNMQDFISQDLKSAFASVTAGIDVEFTDQIDGIKRYAQVKLGPNTINKDDVATLHNHFSTIRNQARLHKTPLDVNQLVIGVLQGTSDQLNGHYKSLENDYHYPVFVGQDFWHRLTGDKYFYEKLIAVIQDSLAAIDGSSVLRDAIESLQQSEEITQLAPE